MFSILPQPKEYKINQGFFRLDGFGVFGFTSPEIVEDCKAFCQKCNLLEKPTVNCILDGEIKGYTLDIEDGITIKGDSTQSIFYGLQSLKQLVLHNLKDEILLPCLHVSDYPSYSYRSYMLDVVRHFYPIENLYKIIDILSLFKINLFHFHLTDDQGWRVEIEKYPRLTEISAFRKQTNGDNTPHGGFYTKQQLRDFVNYAKSKFIEVIPEFDMPGHFTAVLSAYPHLGCTGEKVEVEERFGIFDTIACGGNEEVYTFVYDVLKEMAEIFPSPFFHIGGDEAPKRRWAVCPKCLEKVKAEGLEGIEQLQGFFTKKVTEMLASLGKTPIVWNESLNSGMLDKSAIVQYWNDGKKALNVKKAAREGQRFIMSPCPPFYLDYPSGMHSIKKIYNFEKEELSTSPNLLGFETPLWTEHIASWEKIQKHTFPRVLATAQLGWGKQEDFSSFKNRVLHALSILDFYEIIHESKKDFLPNPLRAIKHFFSFSSNFLKGNPLESLKRAIENDKEMRRARGEKR